MAETVLFLSKLENDFSSDPFGELAECPKQGRRAGKFVHLDGKSHPKGESDPLSGSSAGRSETVSFCVCFCYLHPGKTVV